MSARAATAVLIASEHSDLVWPKTGMENRNHESVKRYGTTQDSGPKVGELGTLRSLLRPCLGQKSY